MECKAAALGGGSRSGTADKARTPVPRTRWYNGRCACLFRRGGQKRRSPSVWDRFKLMSISRGQIAEIGGAICRLIFALIAGVVDEQVECWELPRHFSKAAAISRKADRSHRFGCTGPPLSVARTWSASRDSRPCDNDSVVARSCRVSSRPCRWCQPYQGSCSPDVSWNV